MKTLNFIVIIAAIIVSTEAGSKEVSCVYKGDCLISEIDFDGCDLIIYSSENVGCNNQGGLVWRQSSDIVKGFELKAIAVDIGAKLILSVDLKWTDSWAGFLATCAESVKLQNFISSLSDLISECGCDGINFDFRSMVSTIEFVKSKFNSFLTLVNGHFSTLRLFLSIENAIVNDLIDWDAIISLNLDLIYYFSYQHPTTYQHLAGIYRKAGDLIFGSCLDDHISYLTTTCGVASSKIHCVIPIIGLLYSTTSSTTRLIVGAAANISSLITYNQFCQNQRKYGGGLLGNILGSILKTLFGIGGSLLGVKDNDRLFYNNYFDKVCASLETYDTVKLKIAYAKAKRLRGLVVHNMDNDNNNSDNGESLKDCVKDFHN